MSGYRLVTDATADLNPHLYEGLPEVVIIPMDVMIGEESYLYGPGGNLDLKTFYAKLREGQFASTSQIVPDRFFATFRPLLEEGLDILYIGLTSGLSGTFENACFVRDQLQEEYPDRKIICIDPFCAAAGMGFLFRCALKKQAEGMDLEALSGWILEHRLHLCHYFTVDTFDHLKHGGRVSAASAAIGSMLHIKPLLTVDDEGKLEVVGKPRGRKQAIQVKLKHMEESLDRSYGNDILVAHGDCEEEAKAFAEQILEKFPDLNILMTTIGPVIGSHTGPGMLAVLYWGSRH